MLRAIHETETTTSPPKASIARGLVIASAGKTAMVRLGDGRVVQTAVRADLAEVPGTELIVAQDARGWFVVGPMGGARPSEPVAALPDGTHAVLEGDVIAIRRADGRLVAEHGPTRTVLHSEVAVELSTARALSFKARDSIRMETEDSVFRMDRDGMSFEAPTVVATAQRAELSFAETVFTGVTVVTAVERAKHVAGVVEVSANRIVERAKRTFREVEELSHTRAGRIRQIADGAMHLLAKRAVLKADEDVAVKGDKINLG